MAEDRKRWGIADSAGRAAFYPGRLAARAWRGRIESAAEEVLDAPEVARVLDRALAGSLPEEFARSLVRHKVLERVAREPADDRDHGPRSRQRRDAAHAAKRRLEPRAESRHGEAVGGSRRGRRRG